MLWKLLKKSWNTYAPNEAFEILQQQWLSLLDEYSMHRELNLPSVLRGYPESNKHFVCQVSVNDSG